MTCYRHRDVDQLLLQPLVNYNLSEGWYLSSSPIITANWGAARSQRWSVPVDFPRANVDFHFYGSILAATFHL
jgi:hypothetical protein